jgi:hypothetical protein
VSDGDPYVDFLERVSSELEQAVALFRTHEHAAAVKALGEAVALCGSHPAFALAEGSNIGSMSEVVQACIRDAMHCRLDVENALAALLLRIEALEKTGLH